MLKRLIQSAKERERMGAWDEALVLYEQALARVSTEGDAYDAAELLRWIGTVRRERGDLELAGEAYETSLAVAEANGLHGSSAATLNCLAGLELLQGSVRQAEKLFSQAHQLASSVGDQRLKAMIDQNLGMLANIRGDMPEAITRYRSAIDYYRSVDDEVPVSWGLTNLGMAHVDLNEWDAAAACFQEALQCADRQGDLPLTATIELNQAELSLQQGDYEAAAACCGRSLELFNLLRSRSGVAEVYRMYGVTLRETQRPEQASAYFALALGLAETSGVRLLQAETRLDWGVLHLEEERPREGIVYLNHALRLFGEMQAQREVLDIQRRLERIEGRYLAAVKRWSTRMLNGHSLEAAERVADLSCRLADKLGLEGWDLTAIRVGALIHDIGYSVVSPTTPGSAPASDCRGFASVHPIAGDALAAELDFPPEVRSIVRSHHEQWDGSGFPDRLRGEATPLLARIVCLVHAFDTLTHSQDGHPEHSPSDALHMIARNSGILFDPHLVAAFHEMLQGQCATAGHGPGDSGVSDCRSDEETVPGWKQTYGGTCEACMEQEREKSCVVVLKVRR